MNQAGVVDEALALGVPVFASLDGTRAVRIGEVAGLPQVLAWDVPAQRGQVLTGSPDGVDLAEIEPDGRHVWWFEALQWQRVPFDGGVAEAAMGGVPDGRMHGIAFDSTGSRAAVAVGDGDRTEVYVGVPGRQARHLVSVPGHLELVDMTADGLVVLAGRPDGPDAVCLCAPDGVLTRLPVRQGESWWPMELHPDGRLLLVLRRGEEYLLATRQPGHRVRVEDWTAADTEISARWYGDRVLTQQDRAGRSTLRLVDLAARRSRTLSIPDGTVLEVSCAPDGLMHCLWSNADTPPQVLTMDPARANEPVPRPAPPPDAPRRREIATSRSYGDIPSFLATPHGTGPWPTLFLVHGGPATHDRDCFDPRVEVLVRAGFAVVRTNYRGSTGYGAAWRDGCGHRAGLAQIEDLGAVRDHLIAEGVADPRRVGLSGYSWGGYLALLAAGAQPDLWAVALAAFPIADYPAAYHATTPALREMDERLFGGTPAEVPDRYLRASPMSYVDSVRCPVLLVASPTDDKCPAEPVRRYAEALARRGVRHELAWIGEGHHSRDSADHTAVLALMLSFARDALAGPVPSGFTEEKTGEGGAET
ncbi:alpha/beta hydrolase family protein [Lentzea sp. NPDC004789]